jgi:3-hydroxy-D-aspartate aldolase
MDEVDIHTPCLVLDLAVPERIVHKMGEYAQAHGMRLRSHGEVEVVRPVSARGKSD